MTALPGHVPIQQCLAKLLQTQTRTVICYVDIDSFKPFNDLYGFPRGDEVLLCLAQCLRECIDPDKDFVGHNGSDDFLLALHGHDWRERLNRLLVSFQGQSRGFYATEDLQAGCLSTHNRQGKRQDFPLLSLSLGVLQLNAESSTALDLEQLSTLATEAKRQAKAIPGYSLHILQAG